MHHQAVIDEWAAFLKTVEVARASAHPDTIAFLDAVEKHAREQIALMTAKKGELEASEGK